MPGEESLFTSEPPASPSRDAGHDFVDLVDEEERGSMGQDVLGAHLPTLPPELTGSEAHAEAAVDGDDRAGDVRRFFGGEESNGGGHLLGLGDATERDLGFDLGLP